MCDSKAQECKEIIELQNSEPSESTEDLKKRIALLREELASLAKQHYSLNNTIYRLLLNTQHTSE